MIRKRWLVIFGLAAATTVTGCKDEKVRDYLRKPGPLYQYLDLLSGAVCQLEQKATNLDATKRICLTGPGDKKTIPPYP